ncbi:MAG: ribonuclease E, partial [Pseudomonadota bacterium]
FMENNTTTCPACNGKGHIKSPDSNALMILRMIESEIYKSDSDIINIYAHPDMVLHLLNHKREHIGRLEKLYNCSIVFHKEDTSY